MALLLPRQQQHAAQANVEGANAAGTLVLTWKAAFCSRIEAAAEQAEALEVEATCMLACMVAFIWQIAAICTSRHGVDQLLQETPTDRSTEISFITAGASLKH